MDEWGAVRAIAVAAVWVTVGGGALLASLWVAFGGLRALGPEDELLSSAGVHVDRSDRRVTDLSSAQVGIHALLGLLTASFVTYAMVFSDDRTTAYLGLLVALLVTATPGAMMFWKWRTGRGAARTTRTRGGRVEDRLHRAFVYLHGLAAATTVTMVVVLLIVD